MIRIRRDIWALEQAQAWHPITLAYARAVGTLQGRPATDPTSWSYQGAIHSTAVTPSQPAWNGCQHGGWFFLPWHRIYLYYFERIVRAAVIANGGPSDWALPYWNYDAGGTTSLLPPSFRSPTLPDGSPNPLFVAQRRTGINAGTLALPAAVTSPAAALAMDEFSPPPFPGFGGGMTTVRHFWTETGGVEQTPHNDIHVVIGGTFGWMADPDFAALDPIFWLHHANIDRLWNRWRDDPSHANPSDNAWLTQRFEMFNDRGRLVGKAVRRTLNTASHLDYRYDDDPVPARRGRRGRAMPETARSKPEMVGAADQAIRLVGRTTSVDVPIDEGASPEALTPQAATAKRLYLSVEHIDASRPHGTVYAVYVQAPGGERQHVGNVSLFGVHKVRESRAADESAHDARLTYDVTDVARQAGAGDLRGKSLRVSFEPVTDEPEAAAEAAAAPINIGRVSFFTE
jgi:hypothetical protein